MTDTGFADRPADRSALETGAAFAPKFNDDGIIPVVATDADSGEVLMFAWMNAQSLALTIETGVAHYWSRSRGRLWKKGEESGNTQKVVELRTDCDQDALWMKVIPQGIGAACHVGYKSCFYRAIPLGEAASRDMQMQFREDAPLFDPKQVYKK